MGKDKKKAKKVKKETKKKNSEETEKMIHIIEGYPFLYNPKLPDYHNRPLLAKTFDKVAKQMGLAGVDGEDIKTKWKNVKDTYRRIKNSTTTKSGQSPNSKNRPTWQYWGICHFLKPHMTDAKTESNLDLEPTPEGDSSSEQANSEESDDESDEQTSTEKQSHGASQQRVRKRDATLDGLMKEKAKEDTFIKQVLDEEEDEDKLYCLSLFRRMKKISKENKSWLRIKIEQHCLQAEMYEQNTSHQQNTVYPPSGNPSSYLPSASGNYGAYSYNAYGNSYAPPPPAPQSHLPPSGDSSANAYYGYY